MTDWPPRVLSTVYRNGLQTFYDLLVDLVTNALHQSDDIGRTGGDHRLRTIELRKEAGKRLIGEGDPAEYLTLLKSSYAAMADTAPTLGPISFEQRWTQQQIVERVIALKFRQAAKPSHVLCFGYRKLRPSRCNSNRRRAPQGLECVCENSSVDIVTSHSWKILLSRVGDLIMLHILCHAAIFTPLPNFCFLQILGSPTSCSVSMSRKSFSSHPGERLLGGVTHRKWTSLSYNTDQKQTESAADDSISIADEFKLSYNGKDECAGDKVTGVVQNQNSDVTIFESSANLEDSTCPEITGSSNIILSSDLRRPWIECTESGATTDVREEHNKQCSLGKSKLMCKRQRCGPREQLCLSGKILTPGMGDVFYDPASVSVTNPEVDLLAERSVSSTRNLCSKRKGAEVPWLQCSTNPIEVQLNDNDSSHSVPNFAKRLKLSETREKDVKSQNGSKFHKFGGQVLSNLNMKVLQLSKGSIASPRKSTCYLDHESGAIKCGIVSEHQSLHNCQGSPVVEDACPSPWQIPDACISRKRIRQPSWKRKKLRQAQEACQGLGCKGIAEQVNTSGLQLPAIENNGDITKVGSEEAPVFSSGLHQCQVLEGPDFDCSLPSGRSTGESSVGSKAPQQVPQRRESLNDPGTTLGIHRQLVDRAPIFYNANFACHPGLPAKHILNTTKPNNTGVAHLFAAIFGAHCNISTGQSLKSVHKLLKELLSNAKRCAFARLLGRHCPLPQGFQPVRDDSPPASVTLFQSKGLELDKDMHEDEQQEFPSTELGPEVEEIMSLWLGPNYQPRRIATPRGLEAICISQEASSSSEVEHKESKFSSKGQNTVISHSQTKSKCTKRSKPIETSVGDNLRTEKTLPTELISCYTNHRMVVGFLWAVCRSIIPRDMLGCLRSWRALRSSISHFIGLRRHEKFSVQHALFGLQVSSFSWLAFERSSEKTPIPPKSSGRFTSEERGLQQKRLELWLYWLFTSLVVPTIRAHFYVTENENYRQDIFYYRKPVWSRIQSNGLKELTGKTFKKLSKQAVSQVLNSRVLGFSQIRLLPKRTGLRPIANLAASSQGTLKFSVKGKPTLRQAFGSISKVSSGDTSDYRVSSSHQVVFPILEDRWQDANLEAFETSFTSDVMKIANAAKCSVMAEHSNSSLAVVRGPSCSPSASERSDSLPFLKVPQIRKNSKKSVNFYFRSINSVLRDAHCCLKLEKEAHPDDLGSSVFGYSDIHAKILPFILQLKGSLNGMPTLFMAVCDVTKAYDTIQQDKLQKIVASFMQSSQYNVARYTCITPTLASVRVSHGRACSLADKALKFVDSAHKLAFKRSHSIFTDKALSTSVGREQILAMLGEHVKQNIVQIGAHFYQQTIGIPQGSILSSLLCSLFYGHFDVHDLLPLVRSNPSETCNQVLDSKSSLCESSGKSAESESCLTSSLAKAKRLTELDIEQMLELCLDISDKEQDHMLASRPPVQKYVKSKISATDSPDSHMLFSTSQLREPGETNEKDFVLLRLIDDSLFISTSEGKARIFVESMHRGSKEYGCQANERKTAASFHLQLGSEVLPRNVYKTEDGACFMRWSGLLINCYTLEFQADYTRYCGEHIRSTLTVNREHNQGWQLVVKMCQYLRPKCHALFFDPQINSPATIRLNAFQAFLLCAMKFHAYICCLPHVMESNQLFLYKAIDCAIRYMYGLIRHKMDTVGAEAALYFPYKELQWLALVAFHRVLKRKQARYHILLHMLQTQLQTPKYNILRACPHLSSATDDRRSSMFKFIKY